MCAQLLQLVTQALQLRLVTPQLRCAVILLQLLELCPQGGNLRAQRLAFIFLHVRVFLGF